MARSIVTAAARIRSAHRHSVQTRSLTSHHPLRNADSAASYPQSQQAIGTAPQLPSTAQDLTAQPRHPSAVGHPALESKRTKRGSDGLLYLTFFGLLGAGVPLSYWYWGYREEHMKRKKEKILADLRAKYAAKGD
ncbi:hypothetical protein B0A48_03814 [Cryoendolithus antarcticus]|uniref:Uncharacterized protein n=1 Tax=Cryoendolithus antarcticus TaxID=1507870 RepID=A0A1V8TGK6_9PEZI|nr:hypothetical protein B0A48_03814 [Cryoendolithus antarcticus]